VGNTTHRRFTPAHAVIKPIASRPIMPIEYLRQLTGKTRTVQSNQQLGLALSFVAGATNAGGFLAVHQYTSHMTGIVSSMADRLALGDVMLALAGLGALLSFITGSAVSAILINWGRRQKMHSEYAAPLLVEAVLLLVFGLLGARLAAHATLFAPWTVMLLCLIMGLQNAIITKISHAEIRTTHVTGLVTDLGIELGKLAYWNCTRERAELPPVLANRPRLRLLSALLCMFFVGGLVGALGFKHIGFLATVVLSAVLLFLAIVPVFDDLNVALERARARLRRQG
jgi:uncharacterized membrane protein YoaK (UPF0700 family)